MRYFLLLTLLLITGHQAHAAGSVRDSLLTALSNSTDSKTKIDIYRDLADLTYETQESCGYLIKLAEEARAAKQTRSMMEALTELSLSYMVLEKLDSARYYINIAQNNAPADERDRWCSLPQMRLFVAEMISDKAQEALDEKITKLQETKLTYDNAYQQIRHEYTIGTALYNKGDSAAISYLDRAYKLSLTLPMRDGIDYQVQVLRQLTRAYNSQRNKPKAVEITKKTLDVWQNNYKTHIAEQRPFYPADNFYATIYTSLMISAELLPEDEVKYYVKRLTEMSRKKGALPSLKYNCFMTLANYNVHQNNAIEALRYNDSLIYYARQVATYNLPNVYRIKSFLHEYLKQYKEALINHKEAARQQDSVRNSEAQIEYGKLRMEYDVDRLTYEKGQLEIRNKHVMLILVSIVLVLVAVLCAYLYLSLRREKQLKMNVERHRLRAEESEKLKTAFINSICHEIRTPLNGIVGFSGLLLDPSLDEEERQSFPKEIQQNTNRLVGLIDNMLEVANVEISDELLPRTTVNLNTMCENIHERFYEEHATSNIKGVINLPSEELQIQTHPRYLNLILENLLDNAYKFTTAGTVVIDCHKEAEYVKILVTDTGCGIPIDKQEVVFQRFIKLDVHSPGSGLGLYFCRTSLRRLSGSICIDPSYTNGTRVIITLPIQ